MIKWLIFVGAVFSSAAFAQQVDISGKDFQSGAGDARLAQIAQQAAAEGKTLIVTAPSYWQAKVAAKLQAGAANVQVRQSEGFFENVLVRLVDAKSAAKAEPSRNETATAAAARAATAKAAAERAEAQQAQADKEVAAKVEAARVEAAKEQAVRDETARIEARKAEAARVEAQRIAAAKAAAEKAAAEKAVADKIAAIRQGMEHNLNGDRAADDTLTPTQMKPGDQLFVDGSVRGVVRRIGAHTQLFWLQGDLNLERIELQPSGEGRYKVIRQISDTENPVLRTRAGGQLATAVPPAASATRNSMQQDYAEGRDITETLQPTGLRSGDILYTGDGAAVVVRRAGRSMLRFWLVGDLDLGQVGLMKQQGNAYRVLSDTVK